jgi:hypothetical protein
MRSKVVGTLSTVAIIAIIIIVSVGKRETDQARNVGTPKIGLEDIGALKRKDIIRIQRPGITKNEIYNYMSKSDRIREQLGPIPDGEMQLLVMQTLRNVTVSEEEKRMYYDSNKRVFGSRSYEQSATVVENLIRIEKTKKVLQAE